MHDFFCHEDWTNLLAYQSFTLEDAKRDCEIAGQPA